jgi:hypothetical protein
MDVDRGRPGKEEKGRKKNAAIGGPAAKQLNDWIGATPSNPAPFTFRGWGLSRAHRPLNPPYPEPNYPHKGHPQQVHVTDQWDWVVV